MTINQLMRKEAICYANDSVTHESHKQFCCLIHNLLRDSKQTTRLFGIVDINRTVDAIDFGLANPSEANYLEKEMLDKHNITYENLKFLVLISDSISYIFNMVANKGTNQAYPIKGLKDYREINE